jgi:hypothetical protein
MHGEKALGVSHRLESSHSSLALAGGLVRVLSPVVQSSFPMMGDRRHDILLRGTVARQLIGHDCTGNVPKSLEELSEEALRRLRIAALLHQDVEHFAALVNRAPQIDQSAIDLAEYLVEMPGIPGSELQAPESNGLVRDLDATLEHHLLDVTEAQVEAKVEPHAVGDDLAGKAIAAVAGGR